MAFQIITSRQAAELSGIKILVHSRAGYGKTTLCKTAPYPLILSCESGMLALAELELPTAVIRNMADMTDAYRFITQSAESRYYQTVCLDSITEIAEVVLGTEKNKTKDPRKAYGQMADDVLSLVRGFRDIPGKHVYMSCKQDRNKDEVTGITLYGPRMPGQQVGPQLPYLFDEVFCLDVWTDPATRVSQRFLRTSTDFQFDAKDRSGKLDPFEPPDLNYVINKIMSGRRAA